MIIKGTTLIEILFKLGFKLKKKGLHMLYLLNRRGISKIGICIAKKKIKSSVKRNIIKRRIKIAYKKYRKKFEYLAINIIFVWGTNKYPSLKRLEILMKRISRLLANTLS